MMRWLRILDHTLDQRSGTEILTLTTCIVLIVGGIDYLAGYEVSMSLLYLGPVALAAWYAGRTVGVATAAISCVSWYIADIAAGHHYSHPEIPVWNAFVRFGFFLITSFLVTTLRESLREQQNLARSDGLTGLYGRRAFEERLAHDLALLQRRKGWLTLAYADVDNFKALNDTRGHAEGDRILRLIGHVFQDSMRKTDTAARVGGDEFALVLPDTDSHEAQEAISKITDRLHKALGTANLGVTCSIGVVTILDPEITSQSALAAADALMYDVKRKGKGAVAFSVLAGAVRPSTGSDAPEPRR